MPVVPCVQVSTGRSDPAAAGVITRPVDSVPTPLTSLDAYRTLKARAPSSDVSISSWASSAPAASVIAVSLRSAS